MIAYLTKQFQTVPALMAIYKDIGGQFITTRSNTIKAIKDYNPAAPVIRYTEKFGRYSEGYKVLNRSEAIVTGGPYRNILSKFHGKKYMVFTGTTPSLTVKDIREHHSHFDKLCAIGPRMLQTIEKAALDLEVMQSGYFPFLSFPEKSNKLRHDLLASIKLDVDKKTVVYLPRGEPNGSFDLMMPKFLDAMPNSDFNFIVRPHPSQSVKLHLRDRWRFMKIRQQIRQINNIYLDLNYLRLSELLCIADLVITDGNSPAEESLFYDTPQLLVETDKLSRESIAKVMTSNAATPQEVELALNIYNNGPLTNPSEPDIVASIEGAMVKARDFAAARQENFAFVFGERDTFRQERLIDDLRVFT